MADSDTIIDDAVGQQDAPFLVAMTGNRADVTWSGAAGYAALERAANLDTVFRIFSMSKAVFSMAAMMLMDRGKLSADATVQSILPEFADMKLLDGFDAGGKPVLRAPKVQATVRHLATHTSGLAYEFWNPEMGRYMAAAEHPSVLAGTKQSAFYPLQSEPGTRWDYGIGIDWLGLVVQEFDGCLLDQFCHDEIFGPLGMNDTTFKVNASQAPRLASVSIRGEDGKLGDFALAPPSNPSSTAWATRCISLRPATCASCAWC